MQVVLLKNIIFFIFYFNYVNTACINGPNLFFFFVSCANPIKIFMNMANLTQGRTGKKKWPGSRGGIKGIFPYLTGIFTW